MKQKAKHHALTEKGIDFLAEMEMGHAPPRELIEKNLKINPEQYRKIIYEQSFRHQITGPKNTIGDVLEKGKDFVLGAREKIEELMYEQEQFLEELSKDPPYQGELKAEIAAMDPRSVNVAQYAVQIIVDLAINKINMTEEMMKVKNGYKLTS